MKLDRALSRLTHIQTAIQDIYDLLEGKSFVALRTEKVTRAALERFLEIISEASRHAPDDWKVDHPTIAWPDIANIGNRLRHAYDKLGIQVMWDIYQSDLASLEAAVDQMVDKHGRDHDV